MAEGFIFFGIENITDILFERLYIIGVVLVDLNIDADEFLFQAGVVDFNKLLSQM